jgi:hypothetical protein
MLVALVAIVITISSTAILQSTLPRPCDEVCIQEHIENCDNFQFHRQNAFGGFTVNIMGFQSDGRCSIEIWAFAERDRSTYSCLVPEDRLSAWENWNVADGLDFSQIVRYCTEA